jgi:hypothetical protein
MRDDPDFQDAERIVRELTAASAAWEADPSPRTMDALRQSGFHVPARLPRAA